MSAAATINWIRAPFDTRRFHDFSSLRCRNTFGSVQPCWLATVRDSSLAKVRVAADYSDSVPDSKYMTDRGYHPLEEIKERPKKKDLSLTDVETARTVVEANSKGVLVLPARVHNEPHGHVAWSEFPYVVDDYGDIFFQVPDNGNILDDDDANNPVTVLIGMDGAIVGETSVVTSDFSDHMDVEDSMGMRDDYSKVDTEITDILIEWGMPVTMRSIHPIYFAKCLTKRGFRPPLASSVASPRCSPPTPCLPSLCFPAAPSHFSPVWRLQPTAGRWGRVGRWPAAVRVRAWKYGARVEPPVCQPGCQALDPAKAVIGRWPLLPLTRSDLSDDDMIREEVVKSVCL